MLRDRALQACVVNALEPEWEARFEPRSKVTPAQLEGLAGAAHRVCADVRGEHQQLKSQLSPLFGADWSGAAAAQFTALFDNFDQHAKGLCDALDGIGALLVRAGSSYADVEQQIASSFR